MAEAPPSDERQYQGIGASDGLAAGPVMLLADVVTPTDGVGGPAEQERALAALETVAARLGEAAARQRAAARTAEADILDAAQLMAADPGLLESVSELAATRPAVTALMEATEQQADLLASIPDPYLAARAADVRRLGRQAARMASLTPGSGGSEAHLTRHEGIILARDLGPTDFAELELSGVEIGGIALADGSGASHAAIMARALGVPLVVGLGDAVLGLQDGETVMVDGSAGQLITSPTAETLATAYAEIGRRHARRAALAQSRGAGAVTTDGHPVRLLMNANTGREVAAGLEVGAEGIGLLRTELAFLEAAGWPSAEQHAAAVRPALQMLAGRLATVRTLDFGGDKTPPFLRGCPKRGIALQLAHAGALAAQVRGLLLALTALDSPPPLRIMLPLVESTEQLETARRTLLIAHAEVAPHLPLPALGAMIETRRAVERIASLAEAADFLSIGTNDLAGDLLGVDRLTPAATVRATADPRVLRAIRAVTLAALAQGRSVEVCGEAAGDPLLAVLLVGLGVGELSAAPSRLDEIRAAIRAISLADAKTLAKAALDMDSGDTVLALLKAHAQPSGQP